MKPLLKWIVLIAFVGFVGCGSNKDPNKNLKSIDPNAPKPEAVKDPAKLEGGKVIK